MTEYVGLDVSKEETAFCVKDAAGKILARGKVVTDPEALFAVLKEHCLCPGRIVMETGTLSGWLARELGKLGLVVDVIDARQAHAVMRLQHNKTDANDAALLAEIARTGFCRPVAVKSETAQEGRTRRPGLRPSPSFVAMALNRVGFPFVYAPRRAPDHEDFAFERRGNLDTRRDGHNLRCVFLGSKAALSLDGLEPLVRSP